MFVGEGGVGALHRQMGSQKDWIEQWRDTCWGAQRRSHGVGRLGPPGEAETQQRGQLQE